MAKTLPVVDKDNKTIGHMIMCPACGCGHLFYTGLAGKPNWSFNGDLENPTFTPSMLVFGSTCHPRCHSFVTNGQIKYLSDCAHSMANQTVDLPDMGTVDKEELYS